MRSLDVVGLATPAAEFARLSEILGRAPLESRLLRRPADQAVATICAGPEIPWQNRLRDRNPDPNSAGRFRVRPLPIELVGQINTTYPDDRNNGGLWAGRGLSSGISGGVAVRVGPVSAALRPLLTYQENRPFRIARTLTHGYLHDIYHGHPARIDWPQRFGPDSYWQGDLGQSYIRLDTERVAAGVSTENLWWGPALRHPLLLSNTGPGFPHAFVRTARPIDLWGVAGLEAETILGRLAESKHFDADASNDHRAAAGVIVSVRPAGIHGLEAGAARMRVSGIPPEGRELFDYLLEPFRSGETGNGDEALGLSTVFARWTFPESGFEAYAEVGLPRAVGDTAAGGGDEQDRGNGYVVGVVKGHPVGWGWLRLHAEAMGLQNDISLRTGLPTATFYVHPEVIQGYSHRGQLLGAAAGPGSEAQFLGADLYHGWGSLGVFLERIAYDDDAYYALYARNHGMRGHDLEVAAGLRQTLLWRGFEAAWSFRFGHRRNRDFIPLSEGSWVDRNGSLVISLSWVPVS